MHNKDMYSSGTFYLQVYLIANANGFDNAIVRTKMSTYLEYFITIHSQRNNKND